MYNVGSNSSIRPHLMPGSDPARPFTVVVADNFHYVEKYKEYEYGKFETLEAAIAACKRIVDEFLIEALRPSMTADELYSEYTSFGDDPYIVGSDEQDSELLRQRQAELEREGIPVLCKVCLGSTVPATCKAL